MKFTKIIMLYLIIFTLVIATGCSNNNNKTKENNITKNKLKLENVKPNEDTVNIGKKLEKEYANITVENLFYTDLLEPSDTSGYYTYYCIDSSEKVYLVLKLLVKNLKSTELEGDKIIEATAIYNEKDIYNGFSILEYKDGSNLSTYGSIKPLDTQILYYLFEIPEKLQEDKVEVEIKLQGDKYYIINSNI